MGGPGRITLILSPPDPANVAYRLIDHGASLYFHHGTPAGEFTARVDDPFTRIKEHVLLARASALGDVDSRLAGRLSDDVIGDIVALVPDGWLGDDGATQRAAYGEYLRGRVRGPRPFVEEATRARLSRV